MNETVNVTITVELPIDELRARKELIARYSSTCQVDGFRDPDVRALARFNVACRDTPLPPEPINVGDEVQYLGAPFGGRVIGVDRKGLFVVEEKTGLILSGVAPHGLTKVENRNV